jgi:NhaP-type Na+/H+ and K+/H+ antiporter
MPACSLRIQYQHAQMLSSRLFSNSCTRSLGGSGFLAIWQCTHSIGSAAVNGREPVSI